MLEIEYDILSYISDHPGCKWSEILNEFGNQSSMTTIDAITKCLLKEGLLQKEPSQQPPICSLKLHPSAHRQMSLFQQARKEKARQKKERRTDMVIQAAIALVSAIVGALITLLPNLAQFIP